MNTHEFETLYGDHKEKLYFYVLGMARNRARAEDICSASWAKAWQHRAALNGNAKAWLYQIATNEAKTVYRRESYLMMEPLTDEHHEIPDRQDFTEALERDQERRVLRHAASRLPEPLKGALASHLEGATIATTASRLNLTPGTAGRRIYEAKRELKALCVA